MQQNSSTVRIIEENYNQDTEEFKLVLVGKGLKKYKQIKRLLDLLRMK